MNNAVFNSTLIWLIFLGTEYKGLWPTNSLKMSSVRCVSALLTCYWLSAKESETALISFVVILAYRALSLQPLAFSIIMIGSSKCEISMRVGQWFINDGETFASKSRANTGIGTSYLQKSRIASKRFQTLMSESAGHKWVLNSMLLVLMYSH